MDSAEPSTNGTSALNLHRLSSLLGDDSYADRARKTCAAFEAEIMQHPFLFPSLLAATVVGKLGEKAVVVVGEGKGDEKLGRKLDGAVGKVRGWAGLKGTVVRIGKTGATWDWVVGRNAVLKDLARGRPRVMVCEGQTCREEEL